MHGALNRFNCLVSSSATLTRVFSPRSTAGMYRHGLAQCRRHESRGFGPRPAIESRKDMGDMHVDRAHRYAKLQRNFLIGEPASEVACDLALAGGQEFPSRRRAV